MKGLEGYIEAIWLFQLIVALIICFLTILTISVHRVVAERPNRKRRALLEARKIIAWVIAAAACAHLVNYQMAAKLRADARECHWSLSDEVKWRIYQARYCYLHKDKMLLQLYDAKTKTLLAERTYSNGGVNLVWVEDGIIYDTTEEDGEGWIHFPPTRMDRLRAMLP